MWSHALGHRNARVRSGPLGLSADLGYAEEISRRSARRTEGVDGAVPRAFPVYTAGKRTEEADRPTDGTEVIDVDRGGKITWHGPGQLVAYFIYRLNDPKEVRLFVSQLEDAMIRLLAEYGIEATTVEGRAGVWLLGDGLRRDRKVGAIGIRIHEGVTMHGLALNCSNELGAYESIIPCGISDADTTSISAEIGRTVTPEDTADRLNEILQETITA